MTHLEFEHNWTSVSKSDGMVLVAENDIAHLFDAQRGEYIRSFAAKNSMFYSFGLVKNLVVCLGKIAICWDARTGDVNWKKRGLGTGSNLVAFNRRRRYLVGYQVVRKYGGPSCILDPVSGETTRLKGKRGCFFGDHDHFEHYAYFDGKRTQIILSEDGNALFGIDWRAHKAGVSQKWHDYGIGTPVLVTYISFSEPNENGLVRFSSSAAVALNSPDVECFGLPEGDLLWSWTPPQNEKIVDIEWWNKRWLFLTQRWPDKRCVGKAEYDVLAVDSSGKCERLIIDCDGLALVYGSVLDTMLQLKDVTTGKIVELPKPVLDEERRWPPPRSPEDETQ